MKLSKKLTGLFLIVSILVPSYYFYNQSLKTQAYKKEIVKKYEKQSIVLEQSSTTPKKAEIPITLLFAGDAIPHRQLQIDMHNSKEGFYGLMEPIADAIKSADAAIVNIETTIGIPKSSSTKDIESAKNTWGPNTPYSGYPLFNVHPSYLTALKQAGFSAGQTANNHAMDRSIKGVDTTLSNLRSAGILPFGSRLSTNLKDYPTGHLEVIKQDKTFKIALISCSFSTNGNPDKLSQIPLCFDQSKDVLAEISKQAKDKEVSFVLFMPHWGDEYSRHPNKAQKDFALKAIAAGANAIIGTHPHVLQDIETIEEVPVAYSLGNFFNWSINKDGTSSSVLFKLNLVFNPNASANKLKVVDFKAIPIAANNLRVSKDYHKRALFYVCSDRGYWATDYSSITKSIKKEYLDFTNAGKSKWCNSVKN